MCFRPTDQSNIVHERLDLSLSIPTFRSSGPVIKPLYGSRVLDLHGGYKTQALAELRSALNYIPVEGLRVITGQGRHSAYSNDL